VVVRKVNNFMTPLDQGITDPRHGLYRFPWSQTDNPGCWIEVTDRCNLTCKGCYRHKVSGDRPLEAVKKDIAACHEMTNADAMMIAGGEPLLYPHLEDVVRFIRSRNMKPVILTNGEGLTWERASELKNAGLAKIHFHVDSGQVRPEWTGKNERELNDLRQHYADLCWRLKGVQCGFNATVYRSTLKDIPTIVEWTRANIHKVQHHSLIAYRAIPLTDRLAYMVNGETIPSSRIPNTSIDTDDISISTEEMCDVLAAHFSDFRPCAYLNGSAAPETTKYLIILHAGSRHQVYGLLGAKTVELVQVFYHLFMGRYCSFLRNPKAGRKLFLLSFFDREVRKTLYGFLGAVKQNPLRLFDTISVQAIHLQQPYEIIDGQVNLCDDCANKMMYDGRLISSCRLDEYRMLGGLLTPVPADDIGKKSLVTS
jgi:pyruvate-formate lyase-activating enzyme